MSTGHRHLATIGPGPDVAVLFGAERTVTLDPSAALPTTTFLSMFRLGVEHVLTGYDHLVFLLGLVLLRASLRTLVGIVTAFTVGHSISLALSAFQLVVPDPAWIEPAIALSIAYIGIENFIVRDATRRWRLTGLFGLIHGFGFAGILHELELPTAQIPGIVLSFNLGVEAGQLIALVPALLALKALRERPAFETWGVRGLSTAVALAGISWFCVRTLG